ncbi:MAG: hypothetical protein CVU69_10115 [Deltaproteobacteria bacterium HGW-Deltaproteobacteria-4]|nr:MAG: hypothetical protein CVU69_10115 [Deltaproteobacteria bacterium HGW-Deltaproteobacteria-4]
MFSLLQGRICSFYGLFYLASLLYQSIERRTDQKTKFVLELFGPSLGVEIFQDAAAPPDASACAIAGGTPSFFFLKVTRQQPENAMAEEVRHRNPLIICAELKTVGKIGIKTDTDFPIHVQHDPPPICSDMEGITSNVADALRLSGDHNHPAEPGGSGPPRSSELRRIIRRIIHIMLTNVLTCYFLRLRGCARS